MNLRNRIDALATWGKIISNLGEDEKNHIYFKASSFNNWFTKENLDLSLSGISHYLQRENLEKWISTYDLKEVKPRIIGLVMAGNIPLAGFHDFLTVLVSGNKAQIKLSSQDPFLLPHLVKILLEIAPDFNNQIHFTERLGGFDAVIATGSDNSARYFNYYFGKYPHIIRQNRTSIGVLTGDEGEEDLINLSDDIFQYFGLGCRNVSKIYVPEKFELKTLHDPFQKYEDVTLHHKYNNNYDYNKSIYLVNMVKHLDFEFLLLTESKNLVSPISVLYFEHYTSPEDLLNKVNQNMNKIQCVVTKDSSFQNNILPGNAQKPDLWDYADGVDTLKFLSNLI